MKVIYPSKVRAERGCGFPPLPMSNGVQAIRDVASKDVLVFNITDINDAADDEHDGPIFTSTAINDLQVE